MEKVLYLLALLCVMIHASPTGSPAACSLDCEAPSIHWGYLDYNGPDCWGGCYSLCDTGKTQSPIDIITSGATTGTIGKLTKAGYDEKHDMTLKNNGHAVQVDLLDDTYTIIGIGLGATYTAAQFHVHWGTDSSKGSEHLLNGGAYPMEIHVVHYNSDLYGNLGEAADKVNGLAVLGYFFQISAQNNTAYDPIVNNLKDVKYAGDSTVLTGIMLKDLVPIATQGDFYRYNGSLTTPACHESVIWSVFTDYISISEAQLDEFRADIWTGDITDPYHLLEDSFRPPQPLGSRQIQLYSQLP